MLKEEEAIFETGTRENQNKKRRWIDPLSFLPLLLRYLYYPHTTAPQYVKTTKYYGFIMEDENEI